MPEPPPRSDAPPKIAENGPTELVPGAEGELVERLSGGTATVLVIWLVGIGAGTALLGVWLFSALVVGTRLGLGALIGGPGLYTAIAGAAGPCVLWLAGRAQGHSLGWFAWTSAKIGLVMIGFVALFFFSSMLLFGYLPGAGAPIWIGAAVVFALAGSMVWALATWAADRYIARARIEGER
jgi:hypothetical protein